mgnify:CR=1 FL=1
MLAREGVGGGATEEGGVAWVSEWGVCVGAEMRATPQGSRVGRAGGGGRRRGGGGGGGGGRSGGRWSVCRCDGVIPMTRLEYDGHTYLF